MPNLLDVEDEDQRQDRVATLLARLSSSPLEPPTALLACVQAFLPAIQASNHALARENPEVIDIENVAEDEQQYIEMNLGLGVFEAKRRAWSGSRSTGSSSSESESESSSSSSGNDSGATSSSNDNSDSPSPSRSSVDIKPSSRPIKPLPKRVSQQAKIEVLTSHPASDTDADEPSFL